MNVKKFLLLFYVQFFNIYTAVNSLSSFSFVWLTWDNTSSVGFPLDSVAKQQAIPLTTVIAATSQNGIFGLTLLSPKIIQGAIALPTIIVPLTKLNACDLNE